MSSVLYANPLLMINFIDSDHNPISLANIEKSPILKTLLEQLKKYPLTFKFLLNGYPVETILKFDPQPGNVVDYNYYNPAQDLIFNLASPYPLTKINLNDQQTFQFQLPTILKEFLDGSDFSLDVNGGQTLQNCLGYDLRINLNLKVNEKFGVSVLSDYQFEIGKDHLGNDGLEKCLDSSHFSHKIDGIPQILLPLNKLNQISSDEINNYNLQNLEDFKEKRESLVNSRRDNKSFKLLWWHIILIMIGSLLVIGVLIKMLWPYLKKLKV